MALNTIARMRSRSVELLAALLLFGLCLPAAVSAESKPVLLKFCIKDEAEKEVTKARVSGRDTSGGKLFKIEGNRKGGCYSENINIDETKQYRFTVEAEGLQQRDSEILLSGRDLLQNPTQIMQMIKAGPANRNSNSGASSDGTNGPAVTEPHSPDAKTTTEDTDAQNGDHNKIGGLTRVLNFIASYWLIELILALMVIAVCIMWKVGYRIAVYRLIDNKPALISHIEEAMDVSLRPLAHSIQTMKTNQEALSKQQQAMHKVLEGLQKIQGRPIEIVEMTAVNALPQMRATTPAQEDGKRNLVRKPALEEVAQSAYRRLVQGIAGSLEPIYLNAEANSSPIDMLADSRVYLEEVNNKQGTFVLFKDASDTLGCVFPNPKLKFRQQALNPVFPGITESQFGSDKENIQSVLVSRVGANRWKVEPVR